MAHISDIPSPQDIFQLSPETTHFKSHLSSWKQNLCLLHFYKRLWPLEQPQNSKSSTIALAKGADTQRPGKHEELTYMVEERCANIIQVPEQSEETPAQFVIPDLHKTGAEQRL